MPRAVIVFAVALAVWLAYFYAVDWLIMVGQGLPVGWNLMPAP
jgi:hypothetical protein